MTRRKPGHEPIRCTCTVYGGPSTHHGAKHRVWLRQMHEPNCPHSTLNATTRRFRRTKIKAVPGTKRLIAIAVEEPKKKRRKKRRT